MELKITELFYSIQGESSYTGLPCIFIRVCECNLRCHYCDTKYAYHEGKYYSIQEIMRFVSKYHTKLVTITGGEPLLQPSVVSLTDCFREGLCGACGNKWFFAYKCFFTKGDSHYGH